MHSTMALWQKALTVKHQAAWARTMNVTPAAFSMATKTGRLSPVLAGNIAIELGEDPMQWVAIAALEAEKESPLLARLEGTVNNWRKR